MTIACLCPWHLKYKPSPSEDTRRHFTGCFKIRLKVLEEVAVLSNKSKYRTRSLHGLLALQGSGRLESISQLQRMWLRIWYRLGLCLALVREVLSIRCGRSNRSRTTQRPLPNALRVTTHLWWVPAAPLTAQRLCLRPTNLLVASWLSRMWVRSPPLEGFWHFRRASMHCLSCKSRYRDRGPWQD